MDAVLQVLEKLLARTNDNKIPWKTTVDESAYAASLGNTSVLIKHTRIRPSPLTLAKGLMLQPDDETYYFQIFDKAGIELESISSQKAKNSEMFQELYEKARRFARETDVKLEELLAQLDEV